MSATTVSLLKKTTARALSTRGNASTTQRMYKWQRFKYAVSGISDNWNFQKWNWDVKQGVSISAQNLVFRRYSSDKCDNGSKESRSNSSNESPGASNPNRLALLTICMCACASGGSVILWIYTQLKHRFSRIVILPGNNTNGTFIYPFDPGDVEFFLKKHCFKMLPSRLVTTPEAWKLFKECNQGGSLREIAIAKLSTLDNLLDAECLHFACSVDLNTAIALAHSGADPRLFPAPPVCIFPKDKFKTYFGNTFRNILDPLPSENIHENLNYLFRSALASYLPNEEEENEFALDLYTGFEVEPKTDSFPPNISEPRFLKICLQATVSHTRDLSQLKGLRKTELLDTLVIITGRHANNVEIMSLVLKVIANLSCEKGFAENIRNHGCLRILAQAARSTDVRLLLPAKRALHNLDRENSENILPSGVYQLYPDFRSDEKLLEYDIIFIHGILGGVFRTWRQEDRNAGFGDESAAPGTQTSNEPKAENVLSGDSARSAFASRLIFKTPIESPEETSKYKSRCEHEDGSYVYSDDEIPLDLEHVDSPDTQCWPRDWLSLDCPNSRIIAVDFDSFVTHWSGFCPVETTKRKLHDRANELLHKLIIAGVGQRPIIWVTHSMGGLLTKSLLCQAAVESKEFENICKHTKGIVFCSVPHAGSYIALANTTRRYIFMPTEEALELTNVDNELTHLHERFMRLWRAYKFKILSIGEMLETKSVFQVAFKMVPFSSSDPGIGDFYPIKLNHLNTCKPHCRGSFIYQKIMEMIHKQVEDGEEK